MIAIGFMLQISGIRSQAEVLENFGYPFPLVPEECGSSQQSGTFLQKSSGINGNRTYLLAHQASCYICHTGRQAHIAGGRKGQGCHRDHGVTGPAHIRNIPHMGGDDFRMKTI
jgi:hypothetical protein